MHVIRASDLRIQEEQMSYKAKLWLIAIVCLILIISTIFLAGCSDRDRWFRIGQDPVTGDQWVNLGDRP